MYAVPNPTDEPPAQTGTAVAPMYAVPNMNSDPAPQTDAPQEANPFESAFTKFKKGLFK